MKSRTVQVFVLAVIAALGQHRASAQRTVIDFESTTESEPITTQFFGLGVFFSGGLFGDPNPAGSILGSREATNYQDVFGNTGIFNPITADFTLPQGHADFYVGGYVDTVATIRVQAFRDQVLLGTFEFPAGTIYPGGNTPAAYVRIDIAGQFDQLQISNLSGNRAFSIDNFTFSPVAIPEPSSGVLFAIAIASLVLSVRKKRTDYDRAA